MNVSSRLIASASILPLLFASAAMAQTQGAAPAAAPAGDAASNSTAIGEVVVTARHRSENLQEVPISVSVVSGVQAAAQNLNDLGDISQIVPAIDFRTGASNKDRTVFIRGIGTISTSPGVEPSVSTVIDGVVLARPGMATLDLLDLDHIEVLQGPQGTLFGKNASAGVVNIVTANPTATPHAYVDGSAYTGAEYRLKAGISGPIAGDKLEGLVSVFTAQYRGNVENIYDGVDKDDAGYRHTGARAKFIARPVDNLTLTLGADYTNSEDTTPTGVYASTSRIAYPTGVVTPNPNLAAALAASGITASPDNRTISTNTNSSVHDKNGGVSLQADWTVFGDYTITSISAYRKWKNVQYQDYDMLGVPVGPAGGNFAQGVDTGNVDFDQESQELRIASPKGKFIDYVAGLYYLRAADTERYERDITQLTATNGTVLNNGVANYGTIGNNYAVFGEANINFTKQFRAIAGYREIWDDLSYYHNRVSTSAALLPGVATSVVNGPSSVSRSGYADRFGLQFDVTPDITTYATYSRGYKGPAYNVFFNMNPVNTAPLAAETSNDYEAGVKSSLFDHRLTANVEGFITNFSNYQANFASIIGGAYVTNLINAGTVSTKGVSVDLTARPVRPLTLEANLIYDDAAVGTFNCPANAPTSCDINGQPLPFAPRYKMHLGGEYRVPLAAWADVALQSDYNWQSKVQYQLSENADTVQQGYGIWNAAIALIGTQNGWQARVLVKNILDQHYSSYLAAGTFGGVVRWVPRDDNRYFGLNLRKDF
jgi:iron complex outermembrane receptor protein